MLPEQAANFRTVELSNSERSNELYLCLITCQGRKLRYQEKLLATCIREYFKEWQPAVADNVEAEEGGADR